MDVLDCRGLSWPEAGRTLVQGFNASRPGDRFDAFVDTYPADLKGWFLEAGMRHSAERHPDGGWRLGIRRGETPAQGTMSGLHHIISGADGSVWTCKRDPLVARLDGASGTVVAVAPVARRGSHLARDAAKGLLFVADPDADEIVALRDSDLAVVQRWPAPGGPQLPVVSPGGIVCVTGGRTGTFTMARPIAGAYTAQTIKVGSCPHDPLVARDGEHMFVPCTGASELAKVRLSDGHVVGRCAVGDGPAHLAAHPSRDRFFVANSWDGTLSCLSDDGVAIATVPSGGWAHAIEIAHDGGSVWVANFLDDTVSVFDAERLERLAVLETDAYPHGLDLSPDGCFAGRVDGRLVATATSASPAPGIRWIGMVLVDDACRGRGFGRLILQRAVDHGRDDAVGLDATELGRPLYLKMGFLDVAPIDRWGGVLKRPAQVEEATLDDLLRLDREASEVDRGPLLRHLAAEPGVRLLKAPGGAAILRPGRLWSQLGPVVAKDVGTFDALLGGAAALLGEAPMVVDVPRSSKRTALLEARGLSLRRPLMRMTRGMSKPLLLGPALAAAVCFEWA